MMLTVSIVTYHTDLNELSTCLASLDCKEVDRIYIVDNASDEAMARFARQQKGVVYIASENRGFGAGHNQAIRLAMEAGATYHLVLNSDVRFDPAILGRLTAVMDSRPQTGQLQPKILNADGTPQYTVRMLPTPADLILRRFVPSRFMKGRRERYLLKDLDHDKELNVPYHQGSFMLLRVEALKVTGLFDERFFMYPEDIDLTRRMHERYETLYYPGETVIHDHRASSYHNGRMLWIHVVNMVKYFNKWGWFRDVKRRRFNREIRKGSAK